MVLCPITLVKLLHRYEGTSSALMPVDKMICSLISPSCIEAVIVVSAKVALARTVSKFGQIL